MIFQTTLFLMLPFLSACGTGNAPHPVVNPESIKTMYDYSATDINGKTVKLSDYKGKKVMIVNVASQCGYTKQYKELQELYQRYSDKNFVILGFPCNQFMGQEPGTDAEILSFCSKNYGVTFPMFSKIEVKGKDKHPLYEWLTNLALNGVENSEVSWNFNKYLIDAQGRYVKHYKSGTSPLDTEIINWINS